MRVLNSIAHESAHFQSKGSDTGLRWRFAPWLVVVGLCTHCGGDDDMGTGSTASGGTEASASMDAGSATGNATETTGGPDLDLPLTSADEMYSLTRFPTFHIDIPPDSVAALAEEPKVYVPGSFRYLDVVYPLVGVRFKGNISLTTLDEKPSFKIKFQEYVDDQRFLGLEKLTMHNMHQDSTMMHEHLGYKMFRDLGVPASRTGYVQLIVNGVPYGVYLNVETPDDEMLKRVFADPTGNLYEGEHSDDIDRSPDGWEQDEGDDTSRADLVVLRDIAEREDASLFFGPTAPLDTPRVLAYLLGEAYLGHFDGYWVSHNFFIYHELASDKWTWMPWSLDQTWVRKVDPFDGGGFVKELCLSIPECLTAFVSTGLAGVEHIEHHSDLLGEMDRILYVIDEAAHADTRKRHSNSSMERGQTKLRDWVGTRSEAVRERLDCLDGQGLEPDLDADGFGSCFLDCDDTNANINPDADEVCGDLIDNDCSGFPDDIPECPCPSAVIEGVTFYFCSNVLRWRDAEDYCQDQGHELAWFDTPTQNDAVAAHATSIVKTRWAFGLDDRDTENVYEWPHNVSPEFERWADGEPAHRLDWFDCAFMSSSGSGTWQELNCIQSGPFICR